MLSTSMNKTKYLSCSVCLEYCHNVAPFYHRGEDQVILEQMVKTGQTAHTFQTISSHQNLKNRSVTEIKDRARKLLQILAEKRKQAQHQQKQQPGVAQQQQVQEGNHAGEPRRGIKRKRLFEDDEESKEASVSRDSESSQSRSESSEEESSSEEGDSEAADSTYVPGSESEEEED